MPTGVLSSSSILSLRLPSLEPVLEYGRGVWPLGCGARPEGVIVDLLKLLLEGVMPGLPPLTLWLSCLFGVGCNDGAFRSGLSGRGRDGRLGLNCGLVGRAPGPIDCENFDGRAGVGGVYVFSPLRARDTLVLYDGVFGVAGKESRDTAGELRRSARWIGRKIPAPGLEVWK